MAATALSGFLVKASAAVQARRAAVKSAAAATGPLVAVLGNEGGDMDSVVGSLYLAMALDSKILVAESAAAPDTTFVPLLNFAADDLALRGDVAKLLSGVDTSAYPSVADSPDILELADAIVLFDHNKLKADQRAYEPKVIAIVDHHKDEGVSTNAKPREITVCGSACSLLFKLCFDAAGADVVTKLPGSAEFLSAPIVLDTQNFDARVKKTTVLDLAAITTLLGLPACPAVDDEAAIAELQGKCAPLYQQLNAAKNDVSGLTIPQNLRRDYKAFSLATNEPEVALTVGIAAWLESAEAVLERHGADALINGCLEFGAKAKAPLDMVVIMFAYGEGESFGRQALWLVPPTGPRTPIARAIATRFFHELEDTQSKPEGPLFEAHGPAAAILEKQTVLPRECCGVVHQRNVAISRKTLTPVMQQQFQRAP